MSDFGEAFGLALGLLARLDPGLIAIVGLSLEMSIAAVVLATLIGLPLAAMLALGRFRGRHALVLLANALLGLPPVVVGLAAYLLLSRSGPLGSFGILFTPGAMVIVQTILCTPIITAIAHRALEQIWARYGDEFEMAGVSHVRVLPHLIAIGRPQILTAVLAGFGRSVSEVGAIMIVGGNIAGATRTMTTTIALETSKGNLALALALGMILIALSIAVNGLAFALGNKRNAA
jgi:tungstate transport system permease protein